MLYYRIMSESHHLDAYGCSVNGGRWHPRGARMIYAASSPALSQLEYLCIKGNIVTTTRWFMITYEISKTELIGEMQKESLPHDWNILPHSKATQEFGKAWLTEKEFPFLKVPSARLALHFYPLEHNLLIHPGFPNIQKLMKVVDHVPFGYLLG